MTTLNPPATQKFPENSLERKVYQIVEKMAVYLPVANDRNRLGFALYKYMIGEGDHPKDLVSTTKVLIEGITPQELAQKIMAEIDIIKK